MGFLMQDILRIIRRRFHGSIDLRIGQRGIHSKLIEEARNLLEKRGGIIKLRILRNAAATKEEAQELANLLAYEIGADFAKVIGRSAVIGKISLIKKSLDKTTRKMQTQQRTQTRRVYSSYQRP